MMLRRRHEVPWAASSLLVWLCWMGMSSYTLSVAIPSEGVEMDAVCVALSLSCLFCLACASNLPGGFGGIYFIFLSMLVLFNASQAFLLPWVPSDANFSDPQYKYLLTRQFSEDALIQTFSVVGTFLSALHAGVMTFSAATSKRKIEPTDGKPANVGQKLKGASVGILLLFLITAPIGALQIYNSLSVVMEKGYFGLYDPSQQVYQSALAILATFALPASIYLSHVRGGISRLVGLGYVLLHGTSLLVMGFRAWGMLTLISLAWTVNRTIMPIGRRAVVVAVAVLVLLLPLIGATRNTALTELDLKKLSEAYEEVGSPVFSLLSETGGSAGTVAWTIALVPSERDFGWGQSYITSVTAVVPNLVGGTHVSTQRSLSSWLVWRVSPENAALGGGIGFSAFAELYFNFGFLFGSLAALSIGGLIGWVNTYFERYRDDAIVCAAGAVLLTFLPMYARSDSSMLFRPLVWFVLAPLWASQSLGLRSVSIGVARRAPAQWGGRK